MTKKTEQKLRDGWLVMDQSETKKPSTVEFIKLIQVTRKKQRIESLIFTIVALIIVIAVLLTLAKAPLLFLLFHGIIAFVIPIILLVLFQLKKRGEVNE